jgi:hypothetical protein
VLVVVLPETVLFTTVNAPLLLLLKPPALFDDVLVFVLFAIR